LPAVNHHDCASMPAPFSAADVVVRHIAETCRLAIDGRLAARSLADWTQRFKLGESEFQLLWCLRFAPRDGLDQSTIARQLAFSPAQVSATVERARARDWIWQGSTASDRRRHLWQLSAGGRELLDEMLQAASLLLRPRAAGEGESDGDFRREAAA